MKNVKEIYEAIGKIGTIAELKPIHAAYVKRFRELQAGDTEVARDQFSLQQAVTFESKGRTITGKIIKKNLQTARVSVLPSDGLGYAQLWNVAYTLLCAV